MNSSVENLSGLLRERAAAEFLNVTIRCLQSWRMTGKGPRVVRLGGRMVRYRMADLEEFIDAGVSEGSAVDAGGRGR